MKRILSAIFTALASSHAIGHGWLEYRESGTFVRMLEPGKALFA